MEDFGACTAIVEVRHRLGTPSLGADPLEEIRWGNRLTRLLEVSRHHGIFGVTVTVCSSNLNVLQLI